MGSSSTRPRDSTRPNKPTTSEPPDVQAALYDALDSFSEALAIVQTVSSALQAAQNDLKCPTVGPEIATLRFGVTALVAVHEKFDLAIARVDA